MLWSKIQLRTYDVTKLVNNLAWTPIIAIKSFLAGQKGIKRQIEKVWNSWWKGEDKWKRKEANFWPLHKTCAVWVKIVSSCSEDKKFPNRLAGVVLHLRLTVRAHDLHTKPTSRNLYTFNYFPWPYARSIWYKTHQRKEISTRSTIFKCVVVPHSFRCQQIYPAGFKTSMSLR